MQLVYLLASVAKLVLPGGDGVSAGMLGLAVIVPTAIAAGLAVLITKLRGNGPCTDLRLHWAWREFGLGLMIGFGGLFILLPASVLYISIVGEDATSAAGQLFGGVRTTLPWALVIFVIVVLVAPLCEEVIYRGLLWGAVERRWGRWVALAVTTVVFALAHFELTRIPLLLLGAVLIGLARLYSGGLLASIVAHQVNNLLPGVVVVLGLLGVMPTV